MDKRAVFGSSLCLVLFLFILSPDAGAAVRLGFKAYGGLSYLGGGDLNRGTEGLTDTLTRFVIDLSLPNATTSEEYAPTHWGADFGGDLMLEFSPSFGISVGAGYIESSKSILFPFSNISPLSSLSLRSEARAGAVHFGVQAVYSLPTTSGLAVVFHAGPEYYLASIRSYGLLAANGLTALEFDTDADGGGLGIQAGLGLEYALSPHLGFFIEAAGRYANFAGFDGTTKGNVGGTGLSFSGTLYYVTRTELSLGSETIIRCAPTAPSGPDYVAVREAKIDFSGFNLRLGFVVRLGPKI